MLRFNSVLLTDDRKIIENLTSKNLRSPDQLWRIERLELCVNLEEREYVRTY